MFSVNGDASEPQVAAIAEGAGLLRPLMASFKNSSVAYFDAGTKTPASAY